MYRDMGAFPIGFIISNGFLPASFIDRYYGQVHTLAWPLSKRLLISGASTWVDTNNSPIPKRK